TGGPPPARLGHTAILEAPRNRMIVFAGYAYLGVQLYDVWSLSLSGGTSWSQLNPTGGPPPLSGSLLSVFDSPRDRMITYANNQVWALGPAGAPAWSQIPTTGTGPAGPEAPAGAYDANRQRLVVAMGVGSSASFELELSGAPQWHALYTNTPVGRGYS